MHAVIAGGAALAMLIAGIAMAQHTQPGGPPPAPHGPAPHGTEPYAIETFGVFRSLMLHGDFSAKVALRQVMSRPPSVGVGAVAGARGEITIVDGKSIISYGKSAAHPPPEAETAALLATARVKEWRIVRVDTDVAPATVEGFLAQAAKTHGVDPDKSFPFQLHGTVAPYAMHVNAAPTGGPHGMGLLMAVMVQKRGEEIAGSVVGVFVSPYLMGVASHGGERMHAHWVSPDGQSTAHLDLWEIKAGTTLMLPKPD